MIVGVIFTRKNPALCGSPGSLNKTVNIFYIIVGVIFQDRNQHFMTYLNTKLYNLHCYMIVGVIFSG